MVVNHLKLHSFEAREEKKDYPCPLMNFESLTTLLNRSPAVKLLHAHHAPLILGFLYRTFKETHQLEIDRELLTDRNYGSNEAVKGDAHGNRKARTTG
jgi:hypothetical protein